MTSPRVPGGLQVVDVPRITVGPDDAAAVLGVSRRTFYEHIAPELRAIRVGRRRLYRVVELERWAEANESRALE